LLAAALPSPAAAMALRAARLWPAREYTRVTLESAAPLAHQLIAVRNPERLVLDLEGVEMTAVLQQLAAKVSAADPYIQGIRVALNRPGVTRLVFDLKSEVKPQIFPVPPVGEYGHRLVLDLYPLEPIDPLMALLQEREEHARTDAGDAAKPSDRGAAVAERDTASDNGRLAGSPDRAGQPPAVGGQSAAADRKAMPALADRTGSSPVDANASANAADKSAAMSPPTADANGQRSRADAPRLAESDPLPVRSGRTPRRPLIVMLDPGHGGEDPGAIGRRGTCEKDIVLAIARKLKRRIDREPSVRALMTRDDDYFVPLRERVAKARAVKADLFISIHADAFGNRDVRGSSVFALSDRGATSAAARWLAQSENRADLIGGVNLDIGDPILARTLLDLSQSASLADSLRLGRFMLDELGEVNALHKNYVEQAGFAVLKAPDVPSILIETAFISNPDEEKRLRDERYQHKLAESMLGGIRRYFAKTPSLART
jgi:N-acetylmuramoyl-L-alanine amidase